MRNKNPILLFEKFIQNAPQCLVVSSFFKKNGNFDKIAYIWTNFKGLSKESSGKISGNAGKILKIEGKLSTNFETILEKL